ncbi:MAG: hypothetical protein N3D72_01585, partial [Candidatus Methanomethyliaceae archaeon]|nr:hypothetical protein [Candidatus Methanomethyliaceae archaeon]
SEMCIRDRCNREGKLQWGKVFVFQPESHGMPSKGDFQLCAATMEMVMRKFPEDILSIDAIALYFEELYGMKNQFDLYGIIKMINEEKEVQKMIFPFKEISDAFTFIDSEMVTVVIKFDEKAEELMYETEVSKFPASFSRRLQKYSVQVYSFELEALIKAGAVRQNKVGEIYWFMEDSSFYDYAYGLEDAKDVKAPKETLIF